MRIKSRSVYNIVIFAIVEVVLVFLCFYYRNEIYLYNDAESHINIAKRITSCITPGITQLGGVWLPFQHLLMAPLVRNDWMWHSGLGGSLPSMMAFVLSSYFLYRLIGTLTKNTTAAVFGVMLFMTNLNMAYLSVVPMQEMLLISLFISTVFYLCEWEKKDNVSYLIVGGLFSFLATLTRYDGWFLAFVEIGLIVASLVIRRFNTREIKSRLYVFITWPFYGMILWLVWNILIFGTPLYFATSQYSAGSQQKIFLQNGWLPSYHDFYNSTLTYTIAAAENAGYAVFAMGVVGILLFINNFRKQKKSILLMPLVLIAPFVFYVSSLFLGQAILLVPAIAPEGIPYTMFNLRYGAMMIPAFCVFASFLIGKNKLVNMFLFMCLFVQFIYYASDLQRVVIYADGKGGLSSQAVGKVSEAPYIEKWFREHYDGGLVLYDDYTKPFSPIFLNIPMERFIYVGSGKYWTESMADPSKYATYVVIRQGDALSIGLPSIDKEPRFKKAYSTGAVDIYINKKFIKDGFVYVSKKELMFYDSQFRLKGVNSYDLAYRSDLEIEENFLNLKKAGVNTIRFWMFGDGFEEGFQPEAGLLNEKRFQKTDLIIATADKYNIKLIPVLVNNWHDLGGKVKYIEWAENIVTSEDLFYSDEKTREIFKNYIRGVISRENVLTKKAYSQEKSILAWEIINEPRVDAGHEDDLVNWTKEVVGFTKQIDENHLVFIGTEQAFLNEDVQKNNICSIESVDMCSVHLYLFYDDAIQRFGDFEQLRQYVIDQANFAKKMNKPIIVGELGIPKKQSPFGYDPLDAMNEVVDCILKEEYNGFVIWNWAKIADDSFGFSTAGDEEGKFNLQDLMTVMGREGR